MIFKIYADAEALFDFRLAALKRHNPELEYEVAQNQDVYTTRDHDGFHNLFPVIKEEVKYEVSRELLMSAPLTNVDDLIKEGAQSWVARPDIKTHSVALTVNFMGIPLSKAELDKFRVLISSRFDHGVKVKVINQKVMPLATLDSKFDLAIVYSANERIMKLMTNRRQVLKKCNIYTPFLFLKGDDKTMEQFIAACADMPYAATPEDILKEHMSIIFPLHWIDMKYFCFKRL